MLLRGSLVPELKLTFPAPQNGVKKYRLSEISSDWSGISSDYAIISKHCEISRISSLATIQPFHVSLK